MIQYYSINGKFVPAHEASLRVNDLAILRGYGVFDFFLVLKGVPLFIEDYLNRFFNSAELMDLAIPFSRKEMLQQIQKLIDLNGIPNAGIRLLLTGGYSSNGYTPISPNLLILQYPFPSIAPENYLKGVKLLKHKFQRETAEIKTTNYITGIKLLKKLQASNALEPLFHNGIHISESVRSNFFIVDSNNCIATPDQNVLKGITRKHVIHVAKEAGFQISERPVAIYELYDAKEAFLTSSTKGILPVTCIDELKIGSGQPGSISLELMELFKNHQENYSNQNIIQ